MRTFPSYAVTFIAAIALAAPTLGVAGGVPSNPHFTSGHPDFGPNVLVFNPSMPTAEIQAAVNTISAQQVSNQFGPQRYSLLFMPGTYGDATNPLIIQVGYYTEVAGLGASPTDVVINGHVDVYNQCFPDGSCNALDNFWRSVSNLTINVTGNAANACAGTFDFWAVSQAAPMRRVNVTGNLLFLFDYCGTANPYASGGFIADSQTDLTIINGSQQQFLVRDSTIGGWSNGVWNQVFSGVLGAPPQSFSTTPFNPPPYTTLATSPVTREKPFLYVDSSGDYNVFVPALRTNSSGTTWASGRAAGSSLPIDSFFIATPATSVREMNTALATGQNLIFTPGVYHLDRTIEVKRPDTVVLGMGFATFIPENGVVAMKTADVIGIKLAGLLFDAGPVNSPVLLQVGDPHSHKSDATDPASLQDVFFRIGGAQLGKATLSLVVNSDDVILDDVWAWRADHGTGVGWTLNTADTGLVVEGDNVIAYGLFVEHYQKYEVIWNGENGRTIMFQNEMPYDPPNQQAWMHDGIDGWAAYKVGDAVLTHQGWGLGSYCFFNVDGTIHAAHAFEVPDTPGVQLHDILTVLLNTDAGQIDHVVNDTGGPTLVPGTPVNIVSYP